MLEANPKELDLGNLQTNIAKHFEVSITNTGDKKIIARPSASCGCTTPVLEKGEIEPGETVLLKAVFDTTGKTGFQKKTLYVMYNQEFQNDRYTLSIPFKANI